MASKRYDQSKVIVTKGNLALPAAGQVLWDCPTCDNVGLVLAGFPGQPVAYTYDEDETSATFGQYITVDDTGDGTNALADIPGDIYVGQFTNCGGKSYADDIRTIAGKKLDKCSLEGVKVDAPTCPQPQILASYLDCFDCGDTVTALFSYSDNATQSFGKLREDDEKITCATTIECCEGCGDCNPSATCDQWIGKLVDGLNGDEGIGRKKFSYPDRKIKKPGSKAAPYRFFKLQPNVFSFCVAPTKSDCACDSCVETAAITGITGGAAAGTEFTNNIITNAAGEDVTHMDMLGNIATQIECALNKPDVLGRHSTTAFVTGGTDDCCPAQLWVITCDAGFALNIDPCDNGIKPFEEFIDEGVISITDCESGDCAPEEAATKTFCCGIGVILDQDRIECDCPCDVDYPPNTLLRTGKFTFLKDAKDCSQKVKSRELLCPKPPTGSGGYVRWAEFSQDASGECWRDTSTRQGAMNSLRADKAGRHANAAKFSDCKKQYCHYIWDNRVDGIGHDNEKFCTFYKTDFYIPTCDIVTIDSFTKFYQAFAESSSARCNVVKAGSCVGHGEETLVEAPELDCDGAIVEGEKKVAQKAAVVEKASTKKTSKKK